VKMPKCPRPVRQKFERGHQIAVNKKLPELQEINFSTNLQTQNEFITQKHIS